MGVEELVTAPLDYGVGIWNAENQRDRARKSRNALLTGIDNAQGQYQGSYDDIAEMYNPYIKEGNVARGKRDAMEQELDPSQFRMPELGEYEYDIADPSKFLDPSMDYSMDQMNRATQGSAAATGGLLSGKTLRDLQGNAQGLASQNWGQAMDRNFADRAFGYQDFLNRFNSQKAGIQDRYDKTLSRYNRYNDIAATGYGAQGNVAGQRSALGGQLGGLEIDRGNANAKFETQNSGGWDQAVNGLGKLAGGLTSGTMSAMSGGVPMDVGSMGMQDFSNNLNDQWEENPYGGNPYGISSAVQANLATMPWGQAPSVNQSNPYGMTKPLYNWGDSNSPYGQTSNEYDGNNPYGMGKPLYNWRG